MGGFHAEPIENDFHSANSKVTNNTSLLEFTRIKSSPPPKCIKAPSDPRLLFSVTLYPVGRNASIQQELSCAR